MSVYCVISINMYVCTYFAHCTNLEIENKDIWIYWAAHDTFRFFFFLCTLPNMAISRAYLFNVNGKMFFCQRFLRHKDLYFKCLFENWKYIDKGQLISKCLFAIFNSSKNRMKKFDLNTMVPQDCFHLLFGRIEDTKKTFRN